MKSSLKAKTKEHIYFNNYYDAMYAPDETECISEGDE
jgi:hypothetical protein